MDVQAALCWLSGLKGGGKRAHEAGEIGAVEHGKNWRARNGVRIWLKYAHVLNSFKKKKKNGCF